MIYQNPEEEESKEEKFDLCSICDPINMPMCDKCLGS